MVPRALVSLPRSSLISYRGGRRVGEEKGRSQNVTESSRHGKRSPSGTTPLRSRPSPSTPGLLMAGTADPQTCGMEEQDGDRGRSQ